MASFYVICFDIMDERRLVKVSRALEDFGQRVQRSVFECYLNQADLERLRKRVEGVIDVEEDHVRYYSLCPKDVKKIIVDGPGEVLRDYDYLIY